MYIPEKYVENDRKEIVAFMRKYSFACIVTAKNNVPIATHLPFVVEEEGEEILLTSHFARSNPQWKQIENSNLLVIFTEPHAYISPKHYDKLESVPTWNYIAVHAYGKGDLIEEEAACFKLLESMINNYEQEYYAQWEQLPMDYKQKMLKGIAAFQIKVKELQASRKLSQNKNEGERRRIIESLSNSSLSNENEIAAYMQDLELKKPQNKT